VTVSVWHQAIRLTMTPHGGERRRAGTIPARDVDPAASGRAGTFSGELACTIS